MTLTRRSFTAGTTVAATGLDATRSWARSDGQTGARSIVEVGAAKVAYRVDGSGPGLVLVHGTGGNSETNWSRMVERLSQGRTLVRPDYSGSGATIDDGAPLTVARLAAQIVAAAQKAGATPFDVVGYSLGAAVATYIAAEFPQLVRSVVLLAGFTASHDARQRMQFELWRDLIRTDPRAMARVILLTGFSPDFLASMSDAAVAHAVEDIVANNVWEGMARQVDLDLTLDVRDQARRITKPALIIGCTHDYMVPPAHAKELAALVPGARYREMAAGHLAPLEQPEVLTDLVLDFLPA